MLVYPSNPDILDLLCDIECSKRETETVNPLPTYSVMCRCGVFMTYFEPDYQGTCHQCGSTLPEDN